MIYPLNLVPDCLFIVVVAAIIACLRFDKGKYINAKRNILFNASVYICFINIVIHSIGLICIANPGRIDRITTSSVLIAGFIVSGALALIFYSYLIVHLHSFSPSIYYKVSLSIRYALSAVYFSVIISNYFTGIIFSFSDTGSIIEGKLYSIVLILYITHFLLMIVEFLIFKTRGPRSFYKLAFIATIVCAGATIIQLSFPTSSLNSLYGALAVFIVFVTVQQTANEIDYITSTYTRSMLNALLELRIRKMEKFYILAIKMNQFQQINTRFGAENGDAFLKKVADYLRQIEPNYLYRLKGATFVLVFSEYSDQEYRDIIENIMKRFKNPWFVSANVEAIIDIVLAGSTYTGEDNINSSIMLSNIEYALSVARLDKVNKYFHFDSKMKEDYNRREYIINSIKLAIDERKYLRFCFQPIFKIRSINSINKHEKNLSLVRPVGAEALLRLNDADGVPIPPSEFIPIAESTGQIHEISNITLNMVCDFLNQHNIPDEWFITLNISAQEFIDKRFIKLVINKIEEYGINSKQIKLEITEYTSLVSESSAIDIINLLHEHNIDVFLDDFGTGYSNLFSASHLPIGCVKIDKSLIDNIEYGTPAHGLLDAFIGGFKKFSIPILAEGIEEKWQLETICEMGADMAQGYYLSRPLEKANFLQWVRKEGGDEARP